MIEMKACDFCVIYCHKIKINVADDAANATVGFDRHNLLKGSRQKKNCNFEDIGIKGGWVLVSKPNFFYIRN